ncbi:MAG: hypothetical protein SYR96_12930 [Actinomycetota bacterium]|nr:hypothetical protein [Actinomycetota bacterium]
MTDDEFARLRRELERLRTENHWPSRLLELRGQDTTPAPEQLATPGPVTVASPVPEVLVLLQRTGVPDSRPKYGGILVRRPGSAAVGSI